jgi:uncharacterized protein YjbI with pentapeptide repeats
MEQVNIDRINVDGADIYGADIYGADMSSTSDDDLIVETCPQNLAVSKRAG